MTSLTPYRTPAIREVDPPPTMWPVTARFLEGLLDVGFWIDLATGCHAVSVLIFGALSSLIFALLAVCGIVDVIGIAGWYVLRYVRAWAEQRRVAREKAICEQHFGRVGGQLVFKVLHAPRPPT